MSKVTSKLQVTIPKAIAERYGIGPGDEIEFVAAGENIRIEVPKRRRRELTIEERLALFDEATKRQEERDRRWKGSRNPPDRGWTREGLYGDRGLRR